MSVHILIPVPFPLCDKLDLLKFSDGKKRAKRPFNVKLAAG